MQILSAVLFVRETPSEEDDGPYWVTVLNSSGAVVDAGRSFARRAEARAFAAGLDAAARLHGDRCLLDELKAREMAAFEASLRMAS